MASAFGVSANGLISGGGFDLLKWQLLTAAWVIVFCAIGTYIVLRLVGLFVPLRMDEKDMEEGDVAVHGHEVYPSDVPSLGFPHGVPAAPPPAPAEGAAWTYRATVQRRPPALQTRAVVVRGPVGPWRARSDATTSGERLLVAAGRASSARRPSSPPPASRRFRGASPSAPSVPGRADAGGG